MEVILIYCERSIPAKSVLTKPEIFLLSPPQIGFQEIVTEEISPGIQSIYLLSEKLLLPLSLHSWSGSGSCLEGENAF